MYILKSLCCGEAWRAIRHPASGFAILQHAHAAHLLARATHLLAHATRPLARGVHLESRVGASAMPSSPSRWISPPHGADHAGGRSGNR